MNQTRALQKLEPPPEANINPTSIYIFEIQKGDRKSAKKMAIF